MSRQEQKQEQKKAEARLIAAAEAGDTEGVKAALAAGARTEVSDASGRTPLLLAAGATPDLGDRDGVTPREHAERRGFDRMAELLRKA
ncbi:hypothetical protein AB8B12_25270, partial [Streptomyces sp. PGLac3x]